MSSKLLKKYNISEKDLYTIANIESKKESASFFEKEKLKSKSLGVLKPYNVNFMDLGVLLSEIKNSGYDKDKDLILKYGPVDIATAKSSMGLQIIAPLIIAVGVVFFIVNPFAKDVDPCKCAEFPGKVALIGYDNLSDADKKVFKACENKYTTTTDAMNACIEKVQKK